MSWTESKWIVDKLKEVLDDSTFGLKALRSLVNKAVFSGTTKYIDGHKVLTAGSDSVKVGSWSGRGTLYIASSWSTAKVIVDGVTININFSNTPDKNYVPIPFDTSLELTLNSTDSDAGFYYSIVFI